MNQQTLLHSGTTISAGGWYRMAGPTALLQASLGAAGGTATCNVYGRLSGGPTKLLWTSKPLSGANDHDEYVLDGEPWAELSADISAIGGGATASIAAGY